jgi:hypothetical protein
MRHPAVQPGWRQADIGGTTDGTELPGSAERSVSTVASDYLGNRVCRH